MSTRFYAPDLPKYPADYLLEGDEAHHLRTVCRCRPGDQVELFDGRGTRASASVLTVERHSVHLQLQEIHPGDPISGPTLAVAIPKGDRAATLIEKCTELGVERLVPLRTQRSVADPKQNKQDRWRRTVVEACKQCGRDALMEIDPVTDWPHFCTQADQSPRLLLHPSGPLVGGMDFPAVPSLVAIGPEGGWTDAELELAKAHGWTVVSFPGHILRIETAAIAAAAWLRIR